MASLARSGRIINYGDVAQASILGFSKEEYDVFVNFRGVDTRTGVVAHLYRSLREAQIKVFKDDASLPSGEEMQGKILAAIERSKISIIIISQDYASSAYCLKELAHILKCQEARGLKVMPIFYKVDPSDLRYLRNSFKRIQAHIIKYNGMEVETWKVALKNVANMAGWVIDDTSYEGRIVTDIVEMVKKELENSRKMNFNRKPKKKMFMDHLIGIDDHARALMSMMSEYNNDVLFVLILGMGGIGKTTLARCIYNQLFDSYEFCSFISNVRETLSGEVSLDQLLSVILEQGSSTKNSSSTGRNGIGQFLHTRKVFIVLDDIDSKIQMRLLTMMYTCFGSGSKIMLTTRNRDVCQIPEVRYLLSYELKVLALDQSVQLFSHHACGTQYPKDQFVNLTKKIVSTIGGLPLLLEVIGSSLFGKKVVEWESTFDQLRRIPECEVLLKLLICYQALDNNEKILFLDLASFPNGFDKHLVLEATDTNALDTLEAMSLVKFDNDNKLCMHDLLRDLGREILQAKSSFYGNGLWSNKSRHNVKWGKRVFKPTPSMGEATTTPTQLDNQGYFREGCILQIERIPTTAPLEGKELMVTYTDPWMLQYDFGEFSSSRKLEAGTPEVSLQFNGMTGNTSTIGCNSMETGTSLSQPIAHSHCLFDEINSVLACPQYAMEEKLPCSTQLAISLVDSFIKQINLPDAADVDFTSPSFLQLLESLRQPNALPEVPRELLMAFHGALTSFAGTPEYLDQILSAKSTFSKCIRVRMAKEDEIQKLKFKLDRDKNALQETQREIASLETKLTSLKAKARDLESELSNAIPTVSSLSDELRRCKIQQVEAQARFDNISIFEEHIKTNHQRLLRLLHEIKNLLERKTGNI